MRYQQLLCCVCNLSLQAFPLASCLSPALSNDSRHLDQSVPRRCLYRDLTSRDLTLSPLRLSFVCIFFGSLQAGCFCTHNTAHFVADKNNSSMQQLKWLLTYCQASVSGNRNMCVYINIYQWDDTATTKKPRNTHCRTRVLSYVYTAVIIYW